MQPWRGLFGRFWGSQRPTDAPHLRLRTICLAGSLALAAAGEPQASASGRKWLPDAFGGARHLGDAESGGHGLRANSPVCSGLGKGGFIAFVAIHGEPSELRRNADVRPGGQSGRRSPRMTAFKSRSLRPKWYELKLRCPGCVGLLSHALKMRINRSRRHARGKLACVGHRFNGVLRALHLCIDHSWRVRDAR